MSPLDQIPNWLLNEFFDELSDVLLYIINNSLLNGEFPHILKTAVVYPVVKDPKEDTDDLKNYRPISNLSVLSKILEKVVHSQLNNYLLQNNLYCNVQSGYRMAHSCETLLVKMSDDIIDAMDQKKLVAVILLDLSAAFDVIDHCILIKKLKSLYGIDGIVLQWFESYLKNRSFSVKINKETSCIEIVIHGVPQGSILGPLLFILYTKELANIVARFNLKLHLYADDSSIYVEFNPRDPIDIASTLENISLCLKEVKRWMTINYLKVNEDKTKFFLVGHRSTLRECNLELEIDFCGTTVISKVLSDPENSDVGKSLGVLLDNDFSMLRHILNVKKTCFNHLRNLRNIKEYLETDDKLALVKSLILSRIDFGNALFANIPDCHLKHLHRVINACLRFIYNLSYNDSIKQYYMESHILPIEYRIKFKILILVHKSVYGSGPEYLNNLLSCHTPNWVGRGMGLRSSADTSLLKVKHNAKTSQFAKRRFSIYAPIEWNCLPSYIRDCANLDEFKKLLKTYFFEIFEQSFH